MLVVGLALMGTLDHTTPFWQVAIFMSIMGVGIGALIQNIVLAVQNTVDVSQVGATSATVSFFRSLGGAVGVAVLGAVLANHVATKVAAGLRAAGVPSGGIRRCQPRPQGPARGHPADRSLGVRRLVRSAVHDRGWGVSAHPHLGTAGP